MFTRTVFEILMFESRSVLAPAQRDAGSEMVQTFLILHKYGAANCLSSTSCLRLRLSWLTGLIWQV